MSEYLQPREREYRDRPRIVLQHCAFCGGRGRYVTIRHGRPHELRCIPCNGHGTVTTEGALA
jgi:DnaJ-class molecular chaperone